MYVSRADGRSVIKMKVELISYSNMNERVCGIASKTCVSDHIPTDDEDVTRSLEMATASGHTSVLEHWSATFAIEGISRACSHQLVRHRMASYSQQSQRYVRMDGFEYVVPKSIRENPIAYDDYMTVMRDLKEWYEVFVSKEEGYGIPEEDARYILPNACCTNLVVTMNGRELLHFFNLRCCTRAQWEIRELAERMLELVKEVAPVIFETAGPSCVKLGRCPEKRSCGRCKTT